MNMLSEQQVEKRAVEMGLQESSTQGMVRGNSLVLHYLLDLN